MASFSRYPVSVREAVRFCTARIRDEILVRDMQLTRAPGWIGAPKERYAANPALAHTRKDFTRSTSGQLGARSSSIARQL